MLPVDFKKCQCHMTLSIYMWPFYAHITCQMYDIALLHVLSFFKAMSYGSIFGKRYLLAIDHIMLALFWNYVPIMK